MDVGGGEKTKASHNLWSETECRTEGEEPNRSSFGALSGNKEDEERGDRFRLTEEDVRTAGSWKEKLEAGTSCSRLG